MPLRKKLKAALTRPRRADTPWMSSMTDKYGEYPAGPDGGHDGPTSDPNPTIAGFAPNQNAEAQNRHRASVLIHQKSPLLLATPPQVTRALAYSHPFILPLNHLAGLLSWSTGDPWESFLLVAGFWFAVLYGDVVLRYAGPLVLVLGLILGMFSRRYSPLSSTSWSGDRRKGKHARTGSDSGEQRKSLDEILEALQTFTTRCNILLDPFLRLTDFLSTQTTATSATTRPALTTLFIRILIFSPIWFLLTLPPLYILTTKRITLAFGTLLLSWHSRPARVSRTILWRSLTVRSLTSLLTGLNFPQPTSSPSKSYTSQLPATKASKAAAAQAPKPGIRFTFTLFENQRRWIGLGWTAQLLAYERQAWTDEHLNPTEEPDRFALPDTDHPTTRWRWAPGSSWRVEGAKVEGEKSAKRIGGGGGGNESGWTYYDSKWRDGRRTDGWGRYTRRRKWIRDAELVEVSPDDVEFQSEEGRPSIALSDALVAAGDQDGDADTVSTAARRRGWFARKRTLSGRDTSQGDAGSVSGSAETRGSRDGPEEDVHTPLKFREGDWGREIGEGLAEGLG